jgi:hypothetical protein
VRAQNCRKVADVLVASAAVAVDRMPVAPKRERSLALGRSNEPAPTELRWRGKRVVQPSDETLSTWSFADRNNRFQIGAAASLAGIGVLGSISLSKGHLEPLLARSSGGGTTEVGGQFTATTVAATYLWPVAYINRDTIFEVPIYAGAGLMYETFSTVREGFSTKSDSSVRPSIAAGYAIQFRGFAAEFGMQMSYVFGKSANLGADLPFGFTMYVRYVFGHK